MSKRLIDAEIARLPQTSGLDGRFSQDAYTRFLSQARLTDTELRAELSRLIINRLMLAPAAAEPRIPVGDRAALCGDAARASRGRHRRVPGRAVHRRARRPDRAAGRRPSTAPTSPATRCPSSACSTSPGSAASRSPTSRRPTRKSPTITAPTRRPMAPSPSASSARSSLPSQAAAAQLAAKLRSGQAFVEAARPLGYSAADISVGPQTRRTSPG